MMQDLVDRFNVSRETIEKLGIYRDLLEKWNPRINLVARSTVKQVVERHFVDSLQLWSSRGTARSWVDLGSGGGFPGMVIALVSAAEGAELDVHLIESDARKCAFLRTVSRETSTPVTIHSERIENVAELRAGVVSARALAPLPELLALTKPHLADDGFALYLKGQNCDEELAEASRSWAFEHQKAPSLTDPAAVVLKIWNIRRAEADEQT